jgi:hypothetical protein
MSTASVFSRVRPPTLVALGLATLVLALWRAACIRAGADIDTDAYAHHMIARAILADPRDLAVHWVWLPLFHYAQVPLVLAGGTLDSVRWINLVLTAASPLVLFEYVRRTSRSGGSRMAPEAIGLLAALFAAACPIVMQMGTTGQPEPLFALLVLGVAIAFEADCHVWTGVLLGAAVMLRYEAWAALGVVALHVVWRRGRGWIGVAIPVALILAWAALRRPVDGSWFAFLHQTKQFANDALHQSGGVLGDLLYYPVKTAYRVMGSVLPLAILGAARTVRQQGLRFSLVLAACLGFVSLTWLTRSSLGLDRHFVCVVPLYATFAAQGAAVAADGLLRLTRRPVAARSVGAALAVASLAGLLVQLDVWLGFWRGSIARGWPERQAIAAYVRALPGDRTIYCDEATIELLTGIDRRRFDRHWVDDPHTWDLIVERARAEGTVYVATWRRKLKGHEEAGTIGFAAGFDPADPDATGVAVMRVDGQ